MYLLICAPKEGSDQSAQSAHPHSLIKSVFVSHMKRLFILGYPKCTQMILTRLRECAGLSEYLLCEKKSNFNGSNIFGTIENCWTWVVPSHWRIIMVPGQEVLIIIFYAIIVYWVYLLGSPRWGDSNKYTQFHDKESNFHIYVFVGNFVGTQKRVRISCGKRAIRYRAI